MPVLFKKIYLLTAPSVDHKNKNYLTAALPTIPHDKKSKIQYVYPYHMCLFYEQYSGPG